MFINLLLLSILLRMEEPHVDASMQVVAKEVIVRVQMGHAEPLTGLVKGDFVLSVDGKRVEDFDFREVRWANGDSDTEDPNTAMETDTPGSPTTTDTHTPAQGSDTVRHTALVLDTAFLTPKGWETLRESTLRTLRALPDHERVALFHIDRHLVQLTPFTQDRERLLTALGQIEASSSLLMQERVLRQQIETQKRSFQHQQTMASMGMASNSNSMGGGFRPVGNAGGSGNGTGTNVGTGAAGNLGQNNTQPARTSSRGGDLGRPKDAGLDMILRLYERLETVHNQASKNYLFFVDHIGRQLSPIPGEKSMLVFTGGRLLEEDNLNDYMETVSKLNGRNISVGHMVFGDRDSNIASDNQGIASNASYGQGGSESIGKIESVQRMMSLENIQASPARLSNATAGAYTFTDNSFGARGKVLDRFLRQHNHYYVLTYYTPGDRDQISVRLPRYQEADVFYGEQRDYKADPPNLSELDFESRLLMGGMEESLDAAWGHFEFVNADGTWTIPVYGTLDLDDLDKKERVEIGFLALDEFNQVLDQKTTAIQFKKKPGSFVAYDLLETRQKPAKIRYFFRHEKSGEGNLQEENLDPGRYASDLQLSSLILFQPKPPAYALYQLEEKAERQKTIDPFLNEQGRRIAFSTDGSFSLKKPLFLMFRIHNAEKPLAEYQINMLLLREGESPKLNMSTLELRETSPGHHHFVGAVDPKGMDPGTYQMRVMLKNPETGEDIFRDVTFEWVSQ